MLYCVQVNYRNEEAHQKNLSALVTAEVGLTDVKKQIQDRSQTIRQKMILLLSEREMTARELSKEIGIREREVYDHLYHIGLSLAARRKRLMIPPFGCLSCGYVFEERKRYTRPGRCPHCKGTRIEIPTYRLS